MYYTVQTIVPYNLSGSFTQVEKHHNFNFIHSMPTIGHLYVYGEARNGKISENLFVIQGIINKNFSIVYDKLNQVYGVPINSNVIELPTIIINQRQYQILISGSKNINSSKEVRYINVYFSTSYRKIVLNNGKEINIIEKDIDDFLLNINNYNLD